MAPADKKKSSKTASKNKAVTVAAPQRSILDLLTKRKIPTEDLNGNEVARSETASKGNEALETTAAEKQPSPSENNIQKNVNRDQLPGRTGSQQIDTEVVSDSSTAIQDDIIDITSDDSLPEQPQAGPSEQTHAPSGPSILSSLQTQGPPSQLSQNSNGGSRQDPIILVSSPTKANDSTKPTYSIFASRKPIPKISKHVTQSHLKPEKGQKTLETPFPDHTSQHVRGPQSDFRNSLPQLVKSTRSIDTITVDEEPAFWANLLDKNLSIQPETTPIRNLQSSGREEYLRGIPTDHIRKYPAIRNIIEQTTLPTTVTAFSQELWADRWRPQRAEHVLGNEDNARYIRDWLSALSLQLEATSASPQKSAANKSFLDFGTKSGKSHAEKEGRGTKRGRPEIIRAVKKSKGRKRQRHDSDEENWIVNSDEEIEESSNPDMDGGSEEDEKNSLEQGEKPKLTRLRRMESSPAPSSSPPPIAFKELHNTLLLEGPPGVGKTASVYACAKELGWDVFEVYPGVGKRSGSSLDQLVGDVGKNHLVRKVAAGHKKEGMRDAFTAMLGTGKKVSVDGGEGESLEVEFNERSNGDGGFGFVVPRTNRSSTQHDSDIADQVNDTQQPNQGVRQSLILLEEVDILFEEDRGFWAAVIALIKDCKRPVIMTCNDTNLVPIPDLPLQNILTFEPCPLPIAASYLQGLCFAEGHLIERNLLLDICGSTHLVDAFDAPDAPLHPHTQLLSTQDLRRAIHHAQLLSHVKASADSGLYGFTLEKARDENMEHLADWATIQSDTMSPSDEVHMQAHALRRLNAHTETMSFTDSYLTRKPLDTPEALSFNDHECGPDDEIGHIRLFKASGSSNALSTYHWDEWIFENTMRFSRGILEASKSSRWTNSTVDSTAFQTRALFRARVGYQSQMLELLWPKLVPLQSHLLPRPAVFLDYVPWIRHMAQIDDTYEQTGSWDTTINPRSRRPIRNGTHTAYERQLSLSGDERRIIATTQLEGT